jgi:hypothetical protein
MQHGPHCLIFAHLQNAAQDQQVFRPVDTEVAASFGHGFESSYNSLWPAFFSQDLAVFTF